MAQTVKPLPPEEPSNLDEFEATELDIRQRMNALDEEYHEYFVKRRKLEEELEEFQKVKRAMLDFVRKHRRTVHVTAPSAARSRPPQARATEIPPPDPVIPPEIVPHRKLPHELPWGPDASGKDEVLYVIREARPSGLTRVEVANRIVEITGLLAPPHIPSVTVWLNRLKHDGLVRNSKRRWFAVNKQSSSGGRAMPG